MYNFSVIPHTGRSRSNREIVVQEKKKKKERMRNAPENEVAKIICRLASFEYLYRICPVMTNTHHDTTLWMESPKT